MDPTAAAWAASIVVEGMTHHEVSTHHRDKNQAIAHYKAKLEMVGLKTLKKSQLLSLWDNLRGMQFIEEEGITSIAKSAKKGLWMDFITTCLSLDAAKQLKPINSGAGDFGSSPSAIPPVAAAPVPAAASLPVPTVASAALRFPPNFLFGNFQQMQQQQQQQPFQQMFPTGGQAPFHALPFAYAPMAATPNPARGVAAVIPQMLSNSASPANSSRKRKSPGSSGRRQDAAPTPADEMARAVCARMEASFQNSGMANAAPGSVPVIPANNSDGVALSQVEQRILSDLTQMGFSDRKECLDAIRRAVEKAGSGEPPTADMVMIDIISQREETEEAKKMDEARKLSEAETKRDAERLRQKRKEDEDEILMNADLAELQDPPRDYHRLMFPESWLLRHEPCNNLLVEIINQNHSEAKKALIRILKLEKNSKKWFKAGDLPKCYFTHEVGTRLSAARERRDLQQEMEAIINDLEQGMFLQEHQTRDGIPKMFVAAKEQYSSLDQAAGENTADDDDDDDIIVLDDAEVQQLRARPALDVGARVIEMT